MPRDEIREFIPHQLRAVAPVAPVAVAHDEKHVINCPPRAPEAPRVVEEPEGPSDALAADPSCNAGILYAILPLEFQKRRFSYRQIRREGMVAIYEATFPGCPPTLEVIRIQHQQEHTWPDGRTTPAKEAYPGSEQWGAHGWTCLTTADADQRMAELTAAAAPQRRG